MSNLIRSHKAVTTAPSLPPPTHPSATTAVAQMDYLLVASSVALTISTRRGHHCPRMPNTPSTSSTDASGSQQPKKNTRGPWGSKFPEINVFSNAYVRPRDELAESLCPVLYLLCTHHSPPFSTPPTPSLSSSFFSSLSLSLSLSPPLIPTSFYINDLPTLSSSISLFRPPIFAAST
ncbi:hypothetical protein D8674_031332 [Pyrus ussuriensis x Pyrus communis]|uniref:Uncharacterized protein n=1 Tax=Pyrus ussuriensis x Pyrus communis TaxID=2448454 RepID=A0A5N5F3N7_9ROSA|nr:hypothetical protein D8674_031332 [Pyrus ussuriensis x Pyrus communis]